MALQAGKKIILKVGDGAEPVEVFTQIGGLRATDVNLKNNVVESNNLASGEWRNLINGAGISSLSLSGNGFFTDSTAEEALRSYAFGGTANNYELLFGNGDKISGSFVISSYNRSGDFGSQEDFSISLESAGPVSFAAA